ncbi:MAG: hypothetical protein IRY99_22390, partial [Isosphaeraceae bacterium]|nr:hypothetical protein [Isosphaeraceae bacterium]
MERRIFRSSWFWVVVGTALPALGMLIYIEKEFGGDVSGIYLITPEFHRRLILREVYPSGTLRWAKGAYDSVYFLALANDPTLAAHVRESGASGEVFYRGRRILWPWAGWVLGLGRPGWILYTLPLAQLG